VFAFGRGEAARCPSSGGHSGCRCEFVNAVSVKEVILCLCDFCDTKHLVLRVFFKYYESGCSLVATFMLRS